MNCKIYLSILQTSTIMSHASHRKPVFSTLKFHLQTLVITLLNIWLLIYGIISPGITQIYAILIVLRVLKISLSDIFLNNTTRILNEYSDMFLFFFFFFFFFVFFFFFSFPISTFSSLLLLINLRSLQYSKSNQC